MIEKLKEMLEMQKVLDSAIYDGHGVEYNEEKTYLALLDEIGELNHELKPIWCWWKKTVLPYDRKMVLEELCDCFHFALSVFYHNEYEISEENFDMKEIKFLAEYTNIMYLYCKILNRDNKKGIVLLLMALTHKLGFTWDEIYKAYKEKNQINFERLKSGY